MLPLHFQINIRKSRIWAVVSVTGIFVFGALLSQCNSGGDGAGQRRQRSQVVTASDGQSGGTGATGEASSGVVDDSLNGGAGGTGSLETSDTSGQVATPSGNFKSTSVSFGSGKNGQKLKGFYLRAASQAKAGPGLILIHGMMGLNQGFKKNMEVFASKGYRVFAVDLFDGKLPTTESEAADLIAGLNAKTKAEVIAIISGASDYLFQKLEATSVGIIGWDEGGFWAISTMLAFKKQFRALVNFYGSPFELSNQSSEISTPMMHVFTQEDPKIDITEVISLEEELTKSSPQPVVFQKFQGVEAHFLDPSLPDGQKDQDNIALTYKLTFEFLDKHLEFD